MPVCLLPGAEADRGGVEALGCSAVTKVFEELERATVTEGSRLGSRGGVANSLRDGVGLVGPDVRGRAAGVRENTERLGGLGCALCGDNRRVEFSGLAISLKGEPSLSSHGELGEATVPVNSCAAINFCLSS